MRQMHTRTRWMLTTLLTLAVAGSGVARQSRDGQAGPPAPGRQGGGRAVTAAPTSQALARAVEILSATRQTLGASMSPALTTLIATGRTKRVRGNNLVPIEFEMAIQFPDKYVRKDESPAEETDPTSTGFNGDQLIQYPVQVAGPAGGRPGGPAPTPAQVEAQQKARVTAARQDVARFALGMFADAWTPYQMTFAFSGQAEAPQGRADVLDAQGASGFSLRLFIDSEKHLPIMVSWMLPPTNVIVTAPDQPPPSTVAPGAVVVTGPPRPRASATQEEKDAYAKQVQALQQKARATPVEHRLYFGDFRDVNGHQFPFRLRRAIGADTTEETTFDRFRLNAKIPEQRFVTGR